MKIFDSKNVSKEFAGSNTRDPLLSTVKPNFRATKIRYLALALICTINFGPFFCFDNPQALEVTINNVLNINAASFDWFYSVYSLPNIILPLFGGIIIDRLSLRLSLLLFMIFLVLGQAVVTFGAFKQQYLIMIIGRGIFGIGGECLKMSQAAITSKWFRNKELAFAMGLYLCVSRLGSSMNSLLTPKIYGWTGNNFAAPFLVGLCLAIFSLVGTTSLIFLDKKADEVEGPQVQQKKEKVTFADIKKFSLLFYHLLFNNLLFYGAFFGLNNNLNDIWVKRFGYSPSNAGNYIAIVYLVSAFITPFFGMYLDRKGKRVICIVIASLIFILDNMFIAFVPTAAPGQTEYYMIVALLGVALFYSIYAAVFWPCIPLVVEQKAIGIALGITTATLNLMLFVNPLIVGVINDKTSDNKFGYFWSEIYLSGLVAAGFLITVWMYFEDQKTGGKLHRAGPKRVPKLNMSNENDDNDLNESQISVPSIY